MPSRRHSPFRPGKYKSSPPAGPQGEGERPHRDRYDWTTLWVLIVGTAIVAVSTGVAAYTTLLMRNQLLVMEAQDRPWVTATLTPDNGGVYFRDDGSMSIDIEAELKNVGDMVATEVDAAYVLISGEPKGLYTAIEAAQNAACEETADTKRYITAGVSLFPEESNSERFTLTLEAKDLPATDEFLPRIVGCVTYRFPNSRTVRRTPFAFTVQTRKRQVRTYSTRIVTTHYSGLPVEIGKDVGADMVEFRRSGIGNASAD